MSRSITKLATQVVTKHFYDWKCPECKSLFRAEKGTKLPFIKYLLKEEIREINGIFICNWCASKHEKQ